MAFSFNHFLAKSIPITFFALFLIISFSSALNEKSDQQQAAGSIEMYSGNSSLHQVAGAILTRELDQKHNAPVGGCCYVSACSIS